MTDATFERTTFYLGLVCIVLAVLVGISQRLSQRSDINPHPQILGLEQTQSDPNQTVYSNRSVKK